jgi:hypothetical protein
MHVYYRCYKHILDACILLMINNKKHDSISLFFVVELKWLFNCYYVLVLCNRARVSFQSWFFMFLSSTIKLEVIFNMFQVLKFFLRMFPLFGHFYHAKTNAMFFKKLWQCRLKLCSWKHVMMVVEVVLEKLWWWWWSCNWKTSANFVDVHMIEGVGKIFLNL